MSVIMPPTPGEDELLAPPEFRPRSVERRDVERVAIKLGVTAETLGNRKRRLSGNTVNLSEDGGLVWLPRLGPNAVFLELSIAVPVGAPVRVSAETIWRRGSLVGVRFRRIGRNDHGRLLELLRQPR
jgi:PilZ domain